MSGGDVSAVGLPIPGQQVIEPTGGMAGDAGEDIGKPGLRIDVVELRRHDQRGHRRRPVGTAFGAGKQPDDMTVLGKQNVACKMSVPRLSERCKREGIDHGKQSSIRWP